MGVPKCSLGNRTAAWSILKELFCEVRRKRSSIGSVSTSFRCLAFPKPKNSS